MEFWDKNNRKWCLAHTSFWRFVIVKFFLAKTDDTVSDINYVSPKRIDFV